MDNIKPKEDKVTTTTTVLVKTIVYIFCTLILYSIFLGIGCCIFKQEFFQEERYAYFMAFIFIFSYFILAVIEYKNPKSDNFLYYFNSSINYISCFSTVILFLFKFSPFWEKVLTAFSVNLVINFILEKIYKRKYDCPNSNT